MKNNKLKKGVVSSLALMLLLEPSMVFALSKEETVYSKLNSNGSVKAVYVNEHLINDGKLDIINDYSDLDNIININSNNSFNKNGNTITWDANKSDIFYQGTTNKKLPINEEVTYKLDGKEISLDELLGKEGSVEISIKYTNNELHRMYVNGYYQDLYTPFVVMTSTMIDGDCYDVEVTNGKVINNGGKYMIAALTAPGLYESVGLSELKGLDEVTIRFNTKSFKLNSIYSFVTSKVLDTKDIDGLSKLGSITSDLDKLQSSMDEIESGSNTILEGINALEEGSNLISENLNTVFEKLNEIKAGNLQVSQGLEQILAALSGVSNQLNDEETMNKLQQIQTLISTNTSTINTLTQTNEQLAAAYNNYNLANISYDNLTSNMDLYKVKYNYETYYQVNTNLIMLLTQNNNALTQTLQTINNLKTTVEGLVSTLSTNLTTISNGANALYDGTSLLTSGVSVLNDKTKELATGTTTLKNGFTTLNTGIITFNNEGIKTLSSLGNKVSTITNKIDALSSLARDYETISVGSDNYTTSTKLVLVIDGKEKEEVKVNHDEVKEKESFFKRLINLFKRA